MTERNTQDAREEYLYEYLQEEFRKFSEIRIQIRKEDGERGILVRSEARQWFFPFEWASGHGFKEVHQQVAKIREIFE
jgi:hypothetical protein